MQNITPIFPGFHLPTLRRKSRSAQQQMMDEIEKIRLKSFTNLSNMFEKSIPSALLKTGNTGSNSRNRIYNKSNTFWLFMNQLLSDDGSCQEVVHKLKSYASLRGMQIPSSSTAAYTKARQRLGEEELEKILDYTSEIDEDLIEEKSICLGRRVVVVDGTGLSMPDTKKNREKWDQEHQQKEGCGFPLMQVTACFSLKTGALLSRRQGKLYENEINHFRSMWDVFKKGDIMLGDKGFCAYHDMSMLQKREVDSVVSLAKRKPVASSEAIKVLGKDDLLIHWKKPKKGKTFTKEEWAMVPEELILRQVKVNVQYKGFRTKVFYIVTTLLDEQKYPPEELAELYYRRWDVELFFRDIKTTLGMDVLRSKSPEMIRREILMYLIAYNCLRRLMVDAAHRMQVPVRKVSFKGSVQAVRSWEPHLSHKMSKAKITNMLIQLHKSITQTMLSNPLGRSEPRAIKRRPKNFQLLTTHRSKMVVYKSKNYYRKKS